MKLFILKTDIKTKKKVKVVQPMLNDFQGIDSWSIDLADIDNVLRIEAQEQLEEKEVIDLITTNGFQCESLEE